jgi:hypothetical protein
MMLHTSDSLSVSCTHSLGMQSPEEQAIGTMDDPSRYHLTIFATVSSIMSLPQWMLSAGCSVHNVNQNRLGSSGRVQYEQFRDYGLRESSLSRFESSSELTPPAELSRGGFNSDREPPSQRLDFALRFVG